MRPSVRVSLRATASWLEDPGKGTAVLAYDAGAEAGDFAMVIGNKNNKPSPNPSVSPADQTLYSGAAGASFSGAVAFDADLPTDESYATTIAFAGAYELEIAYREDGALVDAIVITDKLD